MHQKKRVLFNQINKKSKFYYDYHKKLNYYNYFEIIMHAFD